MKRFTEDQIIGFLGKEKAGMTVVRSCVPYTHSRR